MPPTTTLPTRKIGNADVSAIGLGLMGLSGFYSSDKASDEERFKVLDKAIEEGCTFWDTSDFYGDNEDLLGKWFKRTGKRNRVFLATKFGITPNGPNNTPEYINEAVDKSLTRLGIETIDLYYLHCTDCDIPIEKTIKAMVTLITAGKVRQIGLSEVSSATLRRAHAVHPIAAVEIEYSPFFLDIEDDKIALLKTCRELGVKVVAYSPLGRGLLTGRYRSPNDFEEGDWRKTVPKFSEKNFPNILKIADGLKELGAKYNATSGQITLAWILAQGEDIIPIPGTKTIKYLEENLGALKINLSQEDIAEVRNIATKADAAQGDRYPAAFMNYLFADTVEL